MDKAPERKRMRKPRVCDSCGVAPWPGLGVGCPGSLRERPPQFVGVYLWHCGAEACEADCSARYAKALRDAGRHDLAAEIDGTPLRAVLDPAGDLLAASLPSARPATAARKSKRPAADDGAQAGLFGV